jgi:Transposase DDE domain
LVHQSERGVFRGDEERDKRSCRRDHMPDKTNEVRRQKFPQARYQVKNGRTYDQALPQRGSGTLWVTPEAIAAGHLPPTGKRGRACRYSDLALETGPLLRPAFGRPWRPKDCWRSILALLGVSLRTPDHTPFSRRSIRFSSATAELPATGPVDVVIDSTGLKASGAGEWPAEKHGVRGPRTWRQLHLAVNPDQHEILASERTSHEIGDLSRVGPLRDRSRVSLDLSELVPEGQKSWPMGPPRPKSSPVFSRVGTALEAQDQRLSSRRRVRSDRSLRIWTRRRRLVKPKEFSIAS